MNLSVDRLGVLGVLTGAFLVLAALSTVAGTPWTYSGGTLVMVLQLVGVLATILVGVALAWFAYVKA